MRNYDLTIALRGMFLKQFAFIFLCISSIGELQAISISRMRQHQTASSEITPTVPSVLLPMGTSEDKPSFVASAYFIGGYVGNLSNRMATGGVTQTRTENLPPLGKPLYTKIKWCNGGKIDFAVDLKGRTGHSIGASYDFVGSTVHHYSVRKHSFYLPTFATNNFSTFVIQDRVYSYYSLPWFQEGRIWYNRGPLLYPKNAVFSLEPFCGLQVINIHQSVYLRYQDTDTNVMGLNLSEVSYGVGPLIGFINRVHLKGGFAIRSAFAVCIPIMRERLRQTDFYVTNNETETSYQINTKGFVTRPAFGTNIDLDLVYRKDWDTFSLEVTGGWFTEDYLGITSIWQATNNQGSQPGSFGLNLVKAGFSFIF